MKYLAFILALIFSANCLAVTGEQVVYDNRSYENLISDSQFESITKLGTINKPSNTGVGSVPTFTATGVSNTGPGNVVTVTVTPSSSNQIFPHALVQISGGGIPTGISPFRSNPGSSNYTALHVLSVSGNPVSSFTALAPYPYTGSSWSGSATGTVITRGDLSGVTGDGPDGWQKYTQMLLWLEDDPVNIPPMAVRSVGVEKTISGYQYISQNLYPELVRELQGNNLTISFTVNHKVHGGTGTWRPWVSINGGSNIYGTEAPGFGLQYVQEVVAIPANAKTVTVGIAFDGASGDVYYAALPMAAKAYGLPQNYYVQRREPRFVLGNHPANTATLYGASYTFSTSQTFQVGAGSPPATAPGFASDIFGDSTGEIGYSVTGMDADLEVNATTSAFSGKALNFYAFDGSFNYGGIGNNYFPQAYQQTISWTNFVPLNTGRFAVGGSAGLSIQYCNIDIFDLQLGY